MDMYNEPPAQPPAWPTWGAPVAPVAPVADVEAAAPEPKRTKGKWIALGVVLALGLSAIAAVIATRSSTPTEKPALVLSRATKRTTGAGTAHMESTINLRVDGTDAGAVVVAGDENFGSRDSTVTESIAGRAIIEARHVNGTNYASSDLVHLPRGAKWVSITPADVGISQSGNPLATNDPTQGLQFLSAFNGNPKVVGHENIDGISVTHYSFTVNFRSMVEQMKRLGKKLDVPEMARGADAVQHSGIDLAHVPAEAWIDGKGRVRKFAYSLTARTNGRTVTSNEILTFSDFGEPLTITAPAPSAVVPIKRVPDYFTQFTKALTASP